MLPPPDRNVIKQNYNLRHCGEFNQINQQPMSQSRSGVCLCSTNAAEMHAQNTMQLMECVQHLFCRDMQKAYLFIRLLTHRLIHFDCNELGDVFFFGSTQILYAVHSTHSLEATSIPKTTPLPRPQNSGRTWGRENKPTRETHLERATRVTRTTGMGGRSTTTKLHLFHEVRPTERLSSFLEATWLSQMKVQRVHL